MRVDERERLADHLERVDLGEPRAVVAVVQLAQLGDELLLARLVVADAEVGEPLGQRVHVLLRRVDEERGQLGHVVVGELSGLPEVDEPDLIRPQHQDVRRCGSPWKKPCLKIMVIHASVTRYARSRRSSSVYASKSRSASCTPSISSSVSTRCRE
jgi:hypothetical protein